MAKKEAKECRIETRCTKKEAKLFREMAKKKGLTAAAYLRKRIFG